MSEPVVAADAFDTTVPGDPLWGTPYRAIAPLGRGGMGEVWEAEHIELGRPVVVKLLHPELAGDPRVVDRCRLEARTLSQLDDPHVVKVMDFGHTPEGRAYLVMERLVGRTLHKELQVRGPLLFTEAIGFVCQVLSGLAAAHRIGVVHRDIKPDNVFVCQAHGGEPPVVKVLDFGIAKILRVAGRRQGYATQEGLVVGTPCSVAPEQAKCQPVDARTDIYAVGLLLYTLVVGHGPFAHISDALELFNAHVLEPPVPPSQLAHGLIPPELDRAILKALAKRPEERFQTAEEFACELERIAQEVPAPSEELAPMTTRGTLIIRRAGRPVAAPMPVPGSARLPVNLAPRPAPPLSVAFVALTLASAIFFTGMFLLAYRFLGGRG